MPFFVRSVVATRQGAARPPTMAAFRTCVLKPYKKIAVPSFKVTDEIIAYTSPDSTYAVTKRLLDGAKKSIQIGIYDFTAGHMKTMLLNALGRGVKVTLMLDVEPVGGEDRLFRELIDMGVEGVLAPACTSTKARYFSSCHEKFVVIDGVWTLVQSGNYSNNSIPLNERDGGDPDRFVRGNRDTGLAVKSAAMAKFFTTVLRSDIALELNAPQPARAPQPQRGAEGLVWVEAAPALIPRKLFPSKTFKPTAPLTIQPVLSPDNYMDVIPTVLKAARKSILIEQQYIRGSQEKVAVLLSAIRSAIQANPRLDVRIVLGKVFGTQAVADEQQNLKVLKDQYGLALGKNIRYIDTKRFVHCHNKMVIVDGATVLVSSQNWSDSAVSKNREAGLLLTHKGIATYFTDIFENDWATAITKLADPAPASIHPAALRSGGFIQVTPADYREV